MDPMESTTSAIAASAQDPCAQGSLLGDDTAMEMAGIFRALSDPTRLRIVSALVCGEASVGDLAEAVEMSVSAVSHQLRILRDLRIAKSRREGRKVYYSMDDEHVVNIYCYALAHLGHA